MQIDHVVIYGAGDPGTGELRSLAFIKGIPVDFRDIRTTNVSGQHGFLSELHQFRAGTVPQMIAPEGGTPRLLDYDAARAWLDAQPTRKTVSGMAS